MKRNHVNPANPTTLGRKKGFVNLKRLARCLRRDQCGRSIRSLVSIVMIATLLAVQAPASPRALTKAASQPGWGYALWLQASNWAESLRAAVSKTAQPQPARQEGQGERDARAVRIEIIPGDTRVEAGERVSFIAIAYDWKSVPVAGVKYNWKTDYAGADDLVSISDNGDFQADIPGEYMVTAEGAGRVAHVSVKVIGEKKHGRGPKLRNEGSPAPKPKRRVSSHVVPPAGSAAKGDKEVRPADARGQQGARIMRASYSAAASPPPRRPTPQAVQGDLYGWNTQNYMSADDPSNERGDPPQHSSVGANSSSFRLVAPMLSLPGRGLNLELALTYNSRVWNKTKVGSVSEMTFDIDKDTPAPGWSVGFGKMINLSDGGAMLIGADGTRHSFAGDVYDLGDSLTFIGETVDGSFISYRCETNSYGVAGRDFGVVKHPNGTVVWYEGRLVESSGERILYPFKIQDSNGNLITISRDNNKPDRPINYIVDTLGRVITFHYDANNLLTAITAAGLPDGNGGTTVRTLVRLVYRPLYLDYAFDPSLTPKVRDRNINVIKAIYYPPTGTGYWFGDADSYSSYGMISKIVEQRSMGFSAPGLNEQGTVMPGLATTRQAVYNYPLTKEASGVLSDAPPYSSVTETWDGMDTGPAVTLYEVAQEETVRKVITTRPDNSRVVQYAHHAPNTETDGLVFKEEIYSAGNRLLRRSATEYQAAITGLPPRPKFLEVTNELGHTARTDYVYGDYVNELREVREYDYDGSLLRRTVRTYLNATTYSDHNFTIDHEVNAPHNPTYNKPVLLNLINEELVYSGLSDSTLVSKTVYRYDEDDPQPTRPTQPDPPPNCFGCTFEYKGWLQNTPNVTQHNFWFNPYGGVHFFTPAVWWCKTRGNLTSIVSYPRASDATSAITTELRYDVTGNTITESEAGSKKSYSYTLGTQYAYPEGQSGSSAAPDAAPLIGTSAAYDFNTGLPISATDTNGRIRQTSYHLETLRMQEEVLPGGARTLYEYDDAQMSFTETTTLSAGGAVAAKSVRLLNGLGGVRRAEDLALAGAGSWAESVLDIVETKYDKLGRVWMQTRPFRAGEVKRWTETEYDGLGRVEKQTAPDGSVTEAFYNEPTLGRPGSQTGRPDSASSAPGDTTRTRDAWGRERWGRTNAQGRVVEVVEPKPDGDGSVFAAGSLQTSYTYDALDNLTQVVQGAQVRKFRYDDLGRLTHQKLPEQAATLNDAGAYVGSGGDWSSVFAYDARSNLIWAVDARGVKTVLAYDDDPLNRLHTVSYVIGEPHDTSSGIAAAAASTFEYMSTGDITRVRQVTTGNVSRETFTYDAEGRVEHRTMLPLDRPSHPLTISYQYDALGRVKDTTYPAQYAAGVSDPVRRTLHQEYNAAGHASGLKVGDADYASGADYNAAGQLTSLKVGAAGTLQVTEEYRHDPVTGLLTEQKAYRQAGASPMLMMHLSYDYLREGTTAGRTGQLTKITNHLSTQRGRKYTYDALGRLKQATGGDPGSAPAWTQTYTYDRYGNRMGATAAGNTAALKSPAGPPAKMPYVELAAHTQPQLPEFLREPKGGSVTDAPSGLRLFAPAPAAAAATPADAPSGLVVNWTTAEQISLAWAGPAGTYRVERKTRRANGGQYALVSLVTGTAFTDAPNAGAGEVTAYQYRVCAAGSDGNCASAYSNAALGTAITFTDPQLSAGVTPVKAQHFLQLRQAVEAVRFEAYLPVAGWAEELTPRQTPVRATHVEELRNRLYEALTLLRLPTPVFTDPTLNTGAGGTPIRRVHVEELRLRSTRGAGTGSGGCLPDEQFVNEFYQRSLARMPRPGELSYWEGRLRQAAGQGAAARLGVGRELGRALFLSTEYTGRNRSIPEYVGDLYWGYLGRAGDPGGLAHWEREVETYGRLKGVEAFEASGEFQNRVAGMCGPTTGPEPVPTDGHSSLSYDPATNRINTEGWEYDAAGNQTRVRVSSTVWRRMQYDAANRLVAVKSDDGSSSIAAYTYGAGSERLSAYEAGVRTIYMWEEGRVIAEFVEGEASPSSPQWAKNYVYFEDRLLATLTPVTGGELTHYHHPDRLGTRLVTTAVAEAYFYQDTLPFGTANEAESTGNTGRRFTSYDRSPNTGLDYAVNRFYDPLQARFTQVDPVDIEAADLEDPQSFNLYAYCGNDPINSADPDGLWAIGFAIGWGGARGGISLRPFSIFNVGNTALRSWWGTAFWFFQTGNRQGPQPQPHPTPTPSTPVRGEGTSVGSFVGQVVKDTVVGGVKGAYNVFANVPNTINDAVNYGLSWTSIKYRFGRLPEAEYSTNGEAGAGLAVNLIGMFYGVRGASAARTRAGVGSVSARSAVVTQTANTVRRIHGNSRSYPGPTHVYRIDGPMGLWKIGQGIHKLDRMGRSVRAETQVRRLSRQTGQVYRSRILRVFPNKEAALRWERELIRRYTRKHGRRPPGNPVDR